jgi:hypothetical protein
LARLVVDLNTVMEVLLISGSVENLVICRTVIINDKFVFRGRGFGWGSLGLENDGSAY